MCAEQILRTCAEREFHVIAYSFMEDHLHVVVAGNSPNSDFRATVKVMRQRPAIAYGEVRGGKLWHDGYFDRVLRRGENIFALIKYVVDNPKKAGLPKERQEYPYVWSDPEVQN